MIRSQAALVIMLVVLAKMLAWIGRGDDDRGNARLVAVSSERSATVAIKESASQESRLPPQPTEQPLPLMNIPELVDASSELADVVSMGDSARVSAAGCCPAYSATTPVSLRRHSAGLADRLPRRWSIPQIHRIQVANRPRGTSPSASTEGDNPASASAGESRTALSGLGRRLHGDMMTQSRRQWRSTLAVLAEFNGLARRHWERQDRTAPIEIDPTLPEQLARLASIGNGTATTDADAPARTLIAAWKSEGPLSAICRPSLGVCESPDPSVATFESHAGKDHIHAGMSDWRGCDATPAAGSGLTLVRFAKLGMAPLVKTWIPLGDSASETFTTELIGRIAGWRESATELLGSHRFANAANSSLTR